MFIQAAYILLCVLTIFWDSCLQVLQPQPFKASKLIAVCRGVAKPWHTQARTRATSGCALAFACRSFKLAPRTKESARDQKKEEA